MRKIRKTEIIAYLNDKSYRYHYDYWPISWDIKIHEAWPANGRVDKNDIPLCLGIIIGEDGKRIVCFNDPQFDELWETYTRGSDDLFWYMCKEWLFSAGENLLDGVDDPAIQAANDAGVKFNTAGKSNGHLVLDGFNGDRLHFADIGDKYDWDKIWYYNDLWTLYKVCHIVDEIVDNRHESLAYLYADFRSTKEEEWSVIAKLPICKECDNPINYMVVNDDHIKTHFCQCAEPVIPRSSHFYCQNKSCTNRTINMISLEHGHAKYMCKQCSTVAIEVNRWGPIKKIAPLEDA